MLGIFNFIRSVQSVIGLTWVLGLVLVVGCSKDTPPPAQLAVQDLPATFGKAFANAKPQPKELAGQVAAAVQTNGYAQAYSHLQALSGSLELTKEQSSLVGRAMLTVNSLLQSAAAKGDDTAAQAVKIYRSQK